MDRYFEKQIVYTISRELSLCLQLESPYPYYGTGNMKCVFKLILPESFQQRNWQVFWLAPSSMPSHSHGTVAWRFEDTSELTAAVSAQDFHLIPFSLIAPRIEG